MTVKKWYSCNRLLSHNAFISFVMSPRGNGKSYSAKKLIIKNFLKSGAQSVYVRRKKTEIDEVKDTFWSDVSQEFPEHNFKIEGSVGYIDGKKVVYFIPLSTSPNKKSSSYPRVNLIVFDEYIITKTTYNRYLKNEVVLLLDLVETVFRTRTNGRVLMLANSVSYVNPFFSFFDIVPKQEQRFTKYKKGLICLELFTDNDFMEEKKNTPFGRLIEGTEYSKYAVENEVLEDTNDFICERGSFKYRYLACFKYEELKIGVWQNIEDESLFCDERIDNDNINKFCMTLEEQEEGFLYFKGYRNINLRLILIRNSKNEGNIYYETQEIKKIMQDRILPYI